jgi:hypothetical protein
MPYLVLNALHGSECQTCHGSAILHTKCTKSYVRWHEMPKLASNAKIGIGACEISSISLGTSSIFRK